MSKLITFGTPPTAPASDPQPAVEAPDWVQANPARIERSLARALALSPAGVLVLDGSRYRFRHDLVRQALIDQIPPHQRLKMHRQAAQRLVELDAPPALVARHWLDGGHPRDAVPWLLAAARDAVRFHTVSAPPASRFRAMGAPIGPRPSSESFTRRTPRAPRRRAPAARRRRAAPAPRSRAARGRRW